MSQPNIGEELRKAEIEPLLPVEKKLIGWSLGIGVGLLVALPIGIGLGHLRRYSFVAISVANVGRALPTLAVIAVGIVFLPVGFTVVLIALVVLAVPPILTNAYFAVDEIDPSIVEAARGMGMRDRDVLLQVELPLSWGTVRAVDGASRKRARRSPPGHEWPPPSIVTSSTSLPPLHDE